MSACLPTRFRGLLLFALLTGAVLSAPRLLQADGGTIRLADLIFGNYRVTVFTDPTPVRPDTLDVSFLITDLRQLSVIQGLDVWVEVTPLDHDGDRARHTATREQADEPRFYAAKFRLGSVGRWRIDIGVRGPDGEGTASFEVSASQPGLFDNPGVLLVAAILPLLLVGAWLTLGGKSTEPGQAGG